jgi:hypothetical protein
MKLEILNRNYKAYRMKIQMLKKWKLKKIVEEKLKIFSM